MDIERIAGLVGADVVSVLDLGARHSWTLHRLTLADGREVFVKRAAGCANLFATEAAGLRWLREAVPHLVPHPVTVTGTELILPWIVTAAPTAGAAEQFGRDLASLHANTADHYGATWAGYIADLPLDNTPATVSWSTWYAERRLLPYLRLAAPFLDRSDITLIERVIDAVDLLAGPPEPISRIHGDLWSGNILWSDTSALLIDPAAHGGHRETDLAMLSLFGAPHLDRIIAGYLDTNPLSPGWRDRQALHQLHPLLVHVALFGERYREQTLRAAANALGEHHQ
ncbi:fructosamine kinase family protein [Nocardia sp. R7R-8]|uniref:fructosamine kinase family protein n=1 Tax=Nocardia sp. R7R-8 TaxID=3459304 RepID=UPI00403E335B